MPSTTALTIVTEAFGNLNVFLAGQTIPPTAANDGLARLNRMLSSWATKRQSAPAIRREELALTADKGGPSNPYTIGIGGNFNVLKPPNQSSITGAGLLLGGSSPEVEIPRAIATDDMYDAIQVKELSNALFTLVYYNPKFETLGLGQIQLWPVPDNADNQLVLYITEYLGAFSSLSATYYLPDGAEEALIYNLEHRLAGPYGRTMSEDDKLLARTSLQSFRASNLKLSDLPQDPAFAQSRRTGYNIQTGTGGGGGA